jgi:hypothetical protein
MPFVVVYDANALYGNAQRDLLIRIARSGLVQAKWTDEILDEMTRNLSAKRHDIPPERLVRLRELMNSAVADCLVTGYEPLVESLELPDPDDRHVLAAAITKLAARKSSSRRTRRISRQSSCSRGTLRQSSPTTSCLTRSTLTRGSSIPACIRSQAPASTLLKRLRMCWASLNGRVLCSLSLPCA